MAHAPWRDDSRNSFRAFWVQREGQRKETTRTAPSSLSVLNCRVGLLLYCCRLAVLSSTVRSPSRTHPGQAGMSYRRPASTDKSEPKLLHCKSHRGFLELGYIREWGGTVLWVDDALPYTVRLLLLRWQRCPLPAGGPLLGELGLAFGPFLLLLLVIFFALIAPLLGFLLVGGPGRFLRHVAERFVDFVHGAFELLLRRHGRHIVPHVLDGSQLPLLESVQNFESLALARIVACKCLQP